MAGIRKSRRFYKMKIAVEIKANEKSCGKCVFRIKNRCHLFNEHLAPVGQGYKRIDRCKNAEIKNA